MNLALSSPCSPIGIDAGPRTVHAVQLRRSGTGTRIAAAAAVPRQNPGEELSAGEMMRVLGVLRRQGFVGRRAVACVPVSKTLTGVLELPPKGSGAPLDAIARQELARTSKQDAGQIELCWWELPGGAAHATTRVAGATHALAVGCTHADATALLDCFEPAGAPGSQGLDVLALDAAPSAIARACTPRLSGAPALTAMLWLGYDAAVILLARGEGHGNVVFERTLPDAGLRLLCSGIANQLSTDDETTDYVLRTFGCRPPSQQQSTDDAMAEEAADAGALVGAHADGLAAEVLASMNYATRRFDATLSRLLLIGPGADIPGLGARVAEKVASFGLEVAVLRADELYAPAAGVSLPDRAVLGPGAVLALGLALHQEGSR